MNDLEIRRSFHKQRLRRQHAAANTLVVDELGLQHGKSRADIAVINGYLNGYEIKGDCDTLRRFPEQVRAYSAVFDHATLIVRPRHIEQSLFLTPDWWGVVLADEGPRGGVHFETVRPGRANPEVSDFAVAQLLWRSEAAAELTMRGISGRCLRQPRAVLYGKLVELMDSRELRRTVSAILRKRDNWRYQR